MPKAVLNLFEAPHLNLKMPFLHQMNGLRRNDDAMKTAAGITLFILTRLCNLILLVPSLNIRVAAHRSLHRYLAAGQSFC